MKRSAMFWLILLGLTGMAMQNANAGSAVALGPHNQLATAYGGPVAREKQRALAEARRRYGTDVRILAATDVAGYGAIAVARHPNGRGSIIGVALGKRSAAEAAALAIKHCVTAGGTDPKVKWEFLDTGHPLTVYR
jgi:hypothetical protein